MIIDKLNPLPKIPFVDGVPDDATTQTKIIWIKNGETLDGSPIERLPPIRGNLP